MDQLFLKAQFQKLSGLIAQVILLACLLSTPAYTLAEQQTTIISSSSSNYHKSLVESIQSNLSNTDIKIRNLDIDQQETINTNDNLIISVGNKAAEFLDQNSLSNTQIKVITKIDPDEKLPKYNEYHLSMTHSVCQQFALIKLLDTDWSTVSTLLSSPNIGLTKMLEACATQHKLKLKTIVISKYVNIIDALNSSLANSDVLLALPDPSVYNARTVKSILLTTYRHRVPVIGFSESFVRAGALAAIHSSSEQLGKQIAEIIKKHYTDEPINKHFMYPEYFDVVINKDVAKSLGINTPIRTVLTEKLKTP